MKKIHLTLILLVFSIATFAQNWKPYNIDEVVRVNLPDGFTRKDTLGQTMITAQTGYGNILITKLPDNTKTTPDIEKEKHLKKYYNDFVKTIRSSSKEALISNEKDTVLGNLKVKDLTLAVDSGSGKQFRNIRVLHENNATYTFQFLYQEIHKSYAAPEITTFFNSIDIPPGTDVKSQFTDPENTTGKSPYGNRNLIIGIIVAILAAAILFTVLRRRKQYSHTI